MPTEMYTLLERSHQQQAKREADAALRAVTKP
jgi:hypothetical protein